MICFLNFVIGFVHLFAWLMERQVSGPEHLKHRSADFDRVLSSH